MAPVGVTSGQPVTTAGLTAPAPQGPPQPGTPAAPPAATDQATGASAARGTVPASGVSMPAGGDATWALLMDIKYSAGLGMSQSEAARFQQITGTAVTPQPGRQTASAAPAGPLPQNLTDANQAGNVAWALLADIKAFAGMGLTAAEQARFQALTGSAPTAPAAVAPVAPMQPSAGPGQMTVPTELPAGPSAAPAQPSVAPTGQPMPQAQYDREVAWAKQFEGSADARRYNTFKQEHAIRSGQAQGTPSMNDAQYQSEMAWAIQFQHGPDLQRYKIIAAEVQRRQAAGESVRPTGLLGRIGNFVRGLWDRFTNRGSQPQGAAAS